MGRPHRHLAAGAYYHVATKGNNDAPVFHDDWDRTVFLQILEQVRRHFRWRIHASCLLGNHYHLLLETPLANLSDGMRNLNGQYAKAFTSATAASTTSSASVSGPGCSNLRRTTPPASTTSSTTLSTTASPDGSGTGAGRRPLRRVG